MKKLLITSTDLMMIQFLVPHVRHLSENGFHVEIACSVVEPTRPTTPLVSTFFFFSGSCFFLAIWNLS